MKLVEQHLQGHHSTVSALDQLSHFGKHETRHQQAEEPLAGHLG